MILWISAGLILLDNLNPAPQLSVGSGPRNQLYRTSGLFVESRPQRGGFCRFRALHRYFHHRGDVANQFDLRCLSGAVMDDDLLDQAAQDFEGFSPRVFLV